MADNINSRMAAGLKPASVCMTNQQTKNSRQQHDSLFKEAMENPAIARDFMAAWLPAQLKPRCDFTTVRSEPTSFKNTRQDLICDMLYSIRAKASDERLYVIIEHQSTPDEKMVRRIKRYELSVLDRYFSNPYFFPKVVAIVLYHGERTPYPYPVSASAPFNLLTDEPAFRLADVTTIADDELMAHGWAAALEMTLKHTYREYAGISQAVQFLRDVRSLKHSYGHGYDDIVAACEKHWFKYNKLFKKVSADEFIRCLPEEIRGDIMLQLNSWAQQSWQKGMLEGRQKGIAEGRQKGIAEGRQKGIAEGRQKGIAEGRLEGKQKGILEGRQEEKQAIALNLISMGLPDQAVITATGLSADEVAVLKNTAGKKHGQ